MVFFLHRCKLFCLLVLIAAFVLSGCAGAAVAPPQAYVAAIALPLANSDDSSSMLAYLQSTLYDFKIIDDLINDEALNQEISDSSLENYLGILQDYDAKVKSRLADINSREMPNHPDIAAFRASEAAEFQLASDIIGEYTQVLNYYKSMTAAINAMNLKVDVEGSDLQATYDTISKSLSATTDELKSVDVPTFWKSMNDNFVDALNQMNDAVYYLLSSAAMDDPVRANSSLYRWGILTRKFQVISKEAEQDYTDRESKLNADIDSIQKTNDGLRDWVQKNIDKLRNS